MQGGIFLESVMSYSAFADISREISPLRFDASKKVAIKVKSLDVFIRALEAACGILKDEPKGIATASFGGVPVVQNDLVPANMAVIMQGDEIIQIVKFG